MAKAIDGGISDRSVNLDYKFEVPLLNCNLWPVEKVELSEIFNHSGDTWQLHTTKVSDVLKRTYQISKKKDVKFTEDGHTYLLECKLQLVQSTNVNKKIARICCVSDGKTIKSSPITTYSQPGDKCQTWSFWINFYADDEKIGIEVLKSSDAEPSKSQRSVEVLKWFDSIDFGDVTLVAADGKEFGCHRDILERRGVELSRQMFTCEKIDSKENFIQIDGYSGEVVAQLLLYIYTDDVGEIGSIAHRLYEAADKYKLDRLKSLCESAMAANLSANNIVKVYRLATFHHLDQLLAKCVAFLDTHKAEMSVADLLAESLKIQGGNQGQVDQKK